MKLQLLNEDYDRPMKADYSNIIASFFTKSPLASFALEPKESENAEQEDNIDNIEDTIDDISSAARYGRASNFTRADTGGEDEVRGGK